jgi:hypothetical protein
MTPTENKKSQTHMNERNKTRGASKLDAHAPQLEEQAADGPPPAMCTLVFELPPREIVHFKAVIESYDNLATLRTEDPRRHRLKLYFAPEMAAEMNALLDSLAGTFSIRRVSPA